MAREHLKSPELEPDSIHPITQMRRAHFSAQRAYKHLKEALLEEQAEPLGRLRLAFDELDKARAAVGELLR